ncbi:peptidase S10 family protein [Pelomyxa schiedti]|nr:peptidase S10 family protein [Pelomyxa schiedti]
MGVVPLRWLVGVFVVVTAMTSSAAPSAPPKSKSNSIPTYSFTSDRGRETANMASDGVDYDWLFRYTGYIEVDAPHNASLFYWFLESTNGNASAPVIMWLQGGPGCSCTMGMFSENGPYYVTEDLQLYANEASWTDRFHMLFVDQPVGTGYSYTDDPAGYSSSEQDIAHNLYTFLVNFFTKFPQYAKNELYIFGESYAGKYIPSTAYYIYEANLNPIKTMTINLKGIGIGDGWVDPQLQVSVWSDFAYHSGLVNYQQKMNLLKNQDEIVIAIRDTRWIDAYYLWDNLTLNTMEWSGMVNPSDYRIYGFSSFEVFDWIEAWVTQQWVREELGVGNRSFEMTTDLVASYLMEDEMQSVSYLFPTLLDNFKVLIYQGNFDFTVPVSSTETWIRDINWSGREGFKNARRTVWYGPDLTRGYVQSYDTLTFLTAVQAGHMVPMDQPDRAHDMVYRWIYDKGWV